MRKKQVIPDIYLKAYIDNEADANKKMIIVNAIGGGVATILAICYAVHFFTIPSIMYPVVLVLFPVSALLLFSPLLFIKSDRLRLPRFKNFLLFSLMTVVAAINIFLPKHGLLAWTLPIVMASHYYNPRFARVIFFSTITLMLICMYTGMFLGEYDPLLLSSGVEKEAVNTPEGRLELLKDLMAQGNNRYLKVFTLYYIPRVAAISLVFIILDSLNRRTNRLLREEILANGEHEKSRTELNIAKEIQINTLPSSEIDDGEVHIVGELDAAKEVGGDLYDYLYIDENHIAILVGDVSGKGVPAAMFMMKVITSFRDFTVKNKLPSEILKDINTSIIRGNKAGMFVTCFLAIFDKRNGKIIYSNAGHNPPLIGNSFNFRYLKPKQGFLLGMFDDPPLVDEEIVLKKGESITLYTDGITEARNSNGEFYGEERLLETFNKKEQFSIDELHEDLKEDIANFVKDAPQSDDITFVTLKYHDASVRTNHKRFDGTLEDIKNMLSFIGDFAIENEFSEENKNKLLIVSDEILSNVVKYGYQNEGGPIMIRLSFNKSISEFTITVIDKAPEFNQLEVKTDNNNEELHIGGYGLSIVKNIMDEYSYNYADEKNILTLKKIIK
ncbi:MAG: SpoIIE family protein phosphatase [Bacilli bacterium]|nr:SpoIIE family protein phosphatase [Bacilli bacterium]